MNASTHSASSSSVLRGPLWHTDPLLRDWVIIVTGGRDPLLLPRLLQKVAGPEIELRGARYDAGIQTGEARATLELRTSQARAELAARKLGNLVAVRSVAVQAPEPE